MKRPLGLWRWTRKRSLAAAAVLMLAMLAMLAGAPGCGEAKDPWAGEPGSPRVVVTIAPLYSFVKGVLGKQGAVKCLCTTTGPHHYQTETRDARMLQKADAVFAMGLQLDDKFGDALVALTRRKDLPYVKLGEKVPKKMLRDLKHDDDDEDDPKHKHKPGEAGHHHDHGEHDPHLWLGIPEAVAMVEVIRDELATIDKDHADEYKKNAAEYIESLNKLKADGLKKLDGKKVRRIISFHDALGYFARTFDLRIAEVIELGPGDEPTAAHLGKLLKLCRKKDEPIGAITVEPQYKGSSSAGMLQKELKSKEVVIPLVAVDPLETAVPAELKKEGAGWYEARMRTNLNALAEALP